MVYKLIVQEIIDFYKAALSNDRQTEMEISKCCFFSQQHSKLTFGTTYGRVVAIGTYRNGLWLVQFYLPLGIVHCIISTIISFFLNDGGYSFSTLDGFYNEYESNYLLYYFGFFIHLYLITLTTTSMIYGVERIYANRHVPPSYKDCIVLTSGYYKEIALIVLTIILPTIAFLRLITYSKLRIDDIFYDISGTFYRSSLVHDFVYYISTLLDFGFVLTYLYFCTLVTIIVIPCTIFEKITNPLVALKRSYNYTKGQRVQLIIIAVAALIAIAIIESCIHTIRYDILYDFYNDHYYSDTLTFRWFICKCIAVIPDLLFIPWVAILQTVIYCNLSSVHEIRTGTSYGNGGILLSSPNHSYSNSNNSGLSPSSIPTTTASYMPSSSNPYSTNNNTYSNNNNNNNNNFPFHNAGRKAF